MRQDQVLCYQLAQIGIAFAWDRSVREANYFSTFSITPKQFESLDERVLYLFSHDDLPPKEGKLLLRGSETEVYEHDGNYYQYHHFFPEYKDAVCFRQAHNERGGLLIIRQGAHRIVTAETLFRLVDVPAALATYDALMLHASYIVWHGHAILFCAPSGTGKSTQAALWETYADAQIINGDRALIQLTKDGATANGLPFCGSSDICKNVTAPLKAIVLLSQGPQNVVQRLSGAACFRFLIGQVAVSRYKDREYTRMMELVERLIKAVPVLGLSCRPDIGAVQAVMDALK